MFLQCRMGEDGPSAAAVSTPDGLLVGGAGTSDLEALAAVGTTMTDGACERERFGFDQGDLHTRTVQVDGKSFTVTSVGGPLHGADEVGPLLQRLWG